MPAFDLALALSQNELNQAVAAAYWKLYPRIFTGSHSGIISVLTIEWAVTAPPRFNLSAALRQSTISAIADSALEKQSNLSRSNVQSVANELVSSAADLHELMSDMAAFQVEFPKVELVLTHKDGDTVKYTLNNVRANCYVRSTGTGAMFVVDNVLADPLPDRIDNFSVQAFVLPALTNNLQDMLKGLRIPRFDFSGVHLSYSSVSIVDNHVVVAVNMGSKGTPAPAPAGSWTSSGFSLLVSRDILQAVAGQQGKSFSDSGSDGSKFVGYKWDYSLSLVNPQISFSGPNINVRFSLAGSVGATAYISFIPIGIGFSANAVPNPTAECSIVPNNSRLEIVTRSVSPFSVLVTPAGSIPEKIAAWIVSGIVSAVIASVSPLISRFLGGITLASIETPKFSGSIEGMPITLTPVNLHTVGVGEYMGLGGSLAIS